MVLLGDWADLGGVRGIAEGVRAGRLDPVELTERALRRADEVAELGAVVHLDRDGARETAARVADRPTGELAGVPVLVKEIIPVAGMPFTCGSAVFAGRVADADAAVVAAARAAGAVIIGLSHSHEFAYGATGLVNAAGPCRNPHDPDRMPGGSSAGAGASVAAGIVPLALGTDTAGSVRIPAALCGVVGAKPSRHTLPLDGVFPLSGSLDHVGVLTGSVTDARHAIAALGGDLGPGLGGPPRLGLLEHPPPAEPVAQALRAALARIAAQGVEPTKVRLSEWDELDTTGLDLQGSEAAAVHADLLPRGGYQDDVVDRLREAAEVPGWRYVRAARRVAALTAAVDALFTELDAVLLPTVACAAPLASDTAVDLPDGPVSVRGALLRYTRAANVTGHPAFSLPLPGAGLPLGLQILAADNRRGFAAAEWVASAIG